MIVITYIFLLLCTIYSISCESLKCYECSEYIPCGQGQSDLMVDCPGQCMVYLNEFDSNTIIRRCCISGCGPSNGVSNYEGRTTYFCSSDLCNQAGSEAILTGGITLSPTTMTISSLSSTQTTTTVVGQSSLQCYDCSGPTCGQDGSSLAMNCPMCMVYRNPDDQTTTERHCCRSNCGFSFSVSMYNGIQTYFCAYNKCNQYGSENILNPPVTRTTISSITTTSIITTTTTYSPVSCTLNCRNGGTLETVRGCFCYCVDKTNGRECENIDCTRPDDLDPGICLPENRLLCMQSEIFAYKCLRLCGKC